MPADPPGTDPEDRDPRERGLQRRSRNIQVTPWMVMGGIVLLGTVVYVISALTGA